MPYQNDDENHDSESPDPSDADTDADENSIDTIPCPYCDKPIDEQAEICPHCRNYISREQISARKPLWMIITAVVIIARFTISGFASVWCGWAAVSSAAITLHCRFVRAPSSTRQIRAGP